MVALKQLEEAVRAGWCRETSDDPDEWSLDNPARGQCAVTAVVLRDYLGGVLLIADVVPSDGTPPTERHCWNRLDSGIEIDLTLEQFPRDTSLGPPSVREPLVETRAPERYELLAARVRNALGSQASKRNARAGDVR